MTMVRIAVAQLQPAWRDPGENLARAEVAAAAAADADASLVVFPEQFATGWDPTDPPDAEDEDGPVVGAFSDIARDHAIAVLGGFVRRTGGRPQNASVAVGPDGSIAAVYAKRHLFSPAGEDAHYSPGDAPATFDVAGHRFGIAICYDLRFTEIFSEYAGEGVLGVIVPAAWPCRRLAHWELFIRARALDTQCYIAGANTTGDTPVDHYCGGSMVAGPDGEVLVQAGEEEDLIIARLDPARVEEERDRIPVARDR